MDNAKKFRFEVLPNTWAKDDPLVPEHELVAQMLVELIKARWSAYQDVDFAGSAAAEKILQMESGASARLVLALVAHARHYDRLGKQARSYCNSEIDRLNWHHNCPEWTAIWPARQASAQILRRFLKRKLPLESRHLRELADWMAESDNLNDYSYPVKVFVKSVGQFKGLEAADASLRASLLRFAQALRNHQDKSFPKLAYEIEQAIQTPGLETEQETRPKKLRTGPDPAIPALVGSDHVLIQLKEYLDVLPEQPAPGVQVIGYDRFPLRNDSPLRAEHELINILLTEVMADGSYYSPDCAASATGAEVLKWDEAGRGRFVLALAERCANTHFVAPGGLEDSRCIQSQYALRGVFQQFLHLKIYLLRSEMFDLLLFLSALSAHEWLSCSAYAIKAIDHIKKFAGASPLTPGERHVLYRLRCRLVRTCQFGHAPPEISQLNELLDEDFLFTLVPGEAFSDSVNIALNDLPPVRRNKWLELLRHAVTATGSRPSAKWLREAAQPLRAIGTRTFSETLQRWLPLVNETRTVPLLVGTYTSRSDAGGVIHDENANCLRGLLWMIPGAVSPELIRLTGALTVSCYRKIPGVGPRAVKVANAGVYALSQIDDPLALGQLALLKVKVKFGSAQKEIEKAFNAAAEKAGLPREELEEMSVPTYGLTGVGVSEERMGDVTARLSITGTTSTELAWVRADGKIQQSVPASVKESHKEDLKELQAAAKDIQRMLPAQRERIDGLFLAQKTWPLAIWQERYLNHPLVGTLARRLLWEFKNGDHAITAIWFKDGLVDLDLKPVCLAEAGITVQLWHPIGKTTEEIVAWRSWLDSQQIQQPFKQAHRELYLLTDAERQTRIYSNRYAAHVLKQHQFNALCALRSWKNKLRLLVDDEYPPATLNLPKWGLRAEFWIEGIGTNYGGDTNDSGVFHHLSTDQVRFYRVDATQRTAHAGGGGYHPGYQAMDPDPLSLEDVPPLVFSEVMRDVDLFVGVASVGNDPAWADGGATGRFHDYWQHYSFGDLNATARTRKEVLQRLVPRLKIACRCSFVEKFLVVKGSCVPIRFTLAAATF